MPVHEHSLRNLARSIEELARSHPAWSQAYAIVMNCTGHLNALARVQEINQDEARPVQVLTFDYVNWRGETAVRRVNPLSIRWGTSEWYREPQWLLSCFDLDKQDRREFAVARMKNVQQADRP